MDKWQPLPMEEKQMLKEYYRIKNKIFTFILCISQLMAILVSIDLLKNFLQDKDDLLCLGAILTIAIIFGILPEILKNLIKREEYSINKGYAVFCCSYIQKKYITMESISDDASNKSIQSYYIKAIITIDNHKRACNISTDSISYSKMQVGDICNIVFFPLRENEKINIKHIVAFDIEYTVARKYNEIYLKFKN